MPQDLSPESWPWDSMLRWLIGVGGALGAFAAAIARLSRIESQVKSNSHRVTNLEAADKVQVAEMAKLRAIERAVSAIATSVARIEGKLE